MPLKNKRMRIMAGPNGSGKSTVLQEVRKKFYSGPFVNADEIEKLLHNNDFIDLHSIFELTVPDTDFADFLSGAGKSWVQKAAKENTSISIQSKEGILVIDKEPSPYDAALAADYIRHQLLQKGKTFTFETVFSHPSKIDFLNKALENGFKNYLYFICTIDPEININRVEQRVKMGGHPVPEDKIVTRYNGSLELLESIIPLCHRVYLFDNSSEEKSIEPVGEIDSKGRFTIKTTQLPWWVEEFVVQRLYH